MHIHCDNPQLWGSADCSYGATAFEDGRSQAGIAMFLGSKNVPFLSKSQRIPEVVNSSTKGELISLHMVLEWALWSKNLLEEIGFPQDTITIQQDNKSTLRLVNKGPGHGGLSRAYHVKWFYAKQYVYDKTIQLQYVPTKEMWTDCLTKPTEGSEFLISSERLLNCALHSAEENTRARRVKRVRWCDEIHEIHQ